MSTSGEGYIAGSTAILFNELYAKFYDGLVNDKDILDATGNNYKALYNLSLMKIQKKNLDNPSGYERSMIQFILDGDMICMSQYQVIRNYMDSIGDRTFLYL